MMWYDNQALMTPLTLILGAGAGFIIAWMGNRKQQFERIERDAARDAEMHQREDAKAAELREVKLQNEINEHRRAEAERARLESVAVQQRQDQERTMQALTAIATTQHSMAGVLDKTHDLGNSSKTAMETIEAGLRAELKAADLKFVNEVKLNAAELQRVKTEAVVTIAAKDAIIAELRARLVEMALQIPPPASVLTRNELVGPPTPELPTPPGTVIVEMAEQVTIVEASEGAASETASTIAPPEPQGVQ